MGFRRSRLRPPSRSRPRPIALGALFVAAVVLASACGDDTEKIAIGAVGRAPTSSTTEPVALAMVEGLAVCDEVELLAAEEDYQPYGEVSLDQELIAVLGQYSEAQADSFAGMWLDARYSGLPLLAFAGDLDAHRRAIVGQLPDGRGVSFALAEASVSERQLMALASAVVEVAAAADITSLRSTDLDLTRNRVTLDLLDPTETQLDDLLDQIEDAGLRPELFCGITTVSPPIPEGPLDVLPGPDGPRLVSCGDFSFPLASLLERTPISQSDHPAAAVVAQYTQSVDSGDGSAGSASDEWIVLGFEQDRAYFGKYSDGLQATAEAITNGGGWDVAGWAFGCELQVGLPFGLGDVEIFLDPSRPPDPGDRTVRVLVSELACADGREMGRRLLGPQVIESEGQVQLAFAVVEAEPGTVECIGNPVTAVDVELDRPLGGRSLVNGMYLPPKAVTYP